MKKDCEVFQIHKFRSLLSQKRTLFYRLLPGISLTSGLALIAIFLQTLPGIGIFNSLILAIYGILLVKPMENAVGFIG